MKKEKEGLKEEEKLIWKEMNHLDISYSGGRDGNEVTIPLVKQIEAQMNENSVLFLLLIDDNKPKEFFEK